METSSRSVLLVPGHLGVVEVTTPKEPNSTSLGSVVSAPTFIISHLITYNENTHMYIKICLIFLN